MLVMRVFGLWLACSIKSLAASDYNIVNLDNSTFPLIVGKKLPAFVRFDKEYPFGDSANAFKAMAGIVAKSGSDIVIGSVGVGTYGDKPNQDMARKFKFVPEGKEELETADMDKSFPKFMYFPPGDVKGQLYNGATTKAGFLKFLKVEEKTCDVLTGAFCSEEEKTHIKHFEGKKLDEVKAELKKLEKRSGETLKKDERKVVEGRVKVLKKLVKALKKKKA
eukprot:TRINITY_DN76455_c0_g1_i1.p1 TRINITY_DN76455_c0_g1~~TRINITY_DN76455_c0_g1_i1.p1  ORF type:complete len:237 (+),score=73.43 TRINITY_DN76455_c0_g1_i1:49-711(+)